MKLKILQNPGAVAAGDVSTIAVTTVPVIMYTRQVYKKSFFREAPKLIEDFFPENSNY